MSTRFVAAKTIIPSLTPKPSISTKSWFKVCSLSSWPPPIPVPRRRATASISSIKTIQGAFFLASSNKSLTREAPTPTNISTKSDPEMLKNGTPASPATALANKVFPVPGGPTRMMPLGILAPRLVYLWGDRKKSTISSRSSFSSCRPATLLNVTLVLRVMRARLLPKFIILLLPPPAPARMFIIKISTRTIPTETTTGKITLSQ